MPLRVRAIGLSLVAALLVAPAVHAQQEARSAQPGPRQAQPLEPGEVQRLFDAYTLMEAQDALKLTDAQYGPFVTRMKALQDVRRRNQQARMEILRDLRRAAVDNTSPDDALVRERLKALHEQDLRMAAELQKAYAAVDEVLDLTQQARFRVFEENMERKKFDLLMRARQRRGPATTPRLRQP